MSPNFAITPNEPTAAHALLCERLARLEATLLETRGRLLISLDRELASLRGWMDALQGYDPTPSLHKLEAKSVEITPIHDLIAEPPHHEVCNIVPFTTAHFSASDTILREPVLDPLLEQATVDELNAALAAAFQHVADK